MALPRIDAPEYDLTLHNGEAIKYRPFLVKEQKVLLIAYESQDRKQILSAMLNTLENCVHENIDVKIESKTFELVSNFELNVLSFKERVPS